MRDDDIPQDLGCTREYGTRAEVAMLCEVRQGTRPWQKVRLEDISQAGFRIAWFQGCSPDLPLRIRIPGMRLLTAHIRWEQDKAVGCEFAEPLHVAVFEHLARQASGQGPVA